MNRTRTHLPRSLSVCRDAEAEATRAELASRQLSTESTHKRGLFGGQCLCSTHHLDFTFHASRLSSSRFLVAGAFYFGVLSRLMCASMWCFLVVRELVCTRCYCYPCCCGFTLESVPGLC